MFCRSCGGWLHSLIGRIHTRVRIVIRYPFYNSRQTDNGTVLILDGQSAWLIHLFFRQFWRILKKAYPPLVLKRPLSSLNQ